MTSWTLGSIISAAAALLVGLGLILLRDRWLRRGVGDTWSRGGTTYGPVTTWKPIFACSYGVIYKAGTWGEDGVIRDWHFGNVEFGPTEANLFMLLAHWYAHTGDEASRERALKAAADAFPLGDVTETWTSDGTVPRFTVTEAMWSQRKPSAVFGFSDPIESGPLIKANRKIVVRDDDSAQDLDSGNR